MVYQVKFNPYLTKGAAEKTIAKYIYSLVGIFDNPTICKMVEKEFPYHSGEFFIHEDNSVLVILD